MFKKDALKYLEKVADDEPIFILRGRDRYAPSTVAAWSALISSPHKDLKDPAKRLLVLNKASGALLLAEEMRKFQKERGSKIPD